MSKKPKPTPPAKPFRLILYMPSRLMAAIDDAWHRRRLPSRAAAVRELLRESLPQGDRKMIDLDLITDSPKALTPLEWLVIGFTVSLLCDMLLWGLL